MLTGTVNINRSPLSPSLLGAGGLFFCIFLAGCAPRDLSAKAAPASVPKGDLLAPGVVHRAIATGESSGIDVIDTDLATARAYWHFVTGGTVLSQGQIVGQAETPRDWLIRWGGLAAVNGGYFGEYEDAQGRKDYVGLLVQKGKVRHAAPPLTGQGSAAIPRGRYVRSAFGLTAAGRPMIVWAATEPGRPQAAGYVCCRADGKTSWPGLAHRAGGRLRPDADCRGKSGRHGLAESAWSALARSRAPLSLMTA